jgi:NADH-quinone oxidoreductase subunit A
LLAEYGYIGLFLIVALAFPVIIIIIPVVFRFLGVVPSNPSPTKLANFECGLETIGKTWVQFNPHYYFYALVFLAVDVLVVFLYPWAVRLRQLGTFGFVGVLVLLSIVMVGYMYAWRKNVLEWK